MTLHKVETFARGGGMTVIERKGFTYSSEGSHQLSRKSKMINLNSNIPLGHSTLFGQKQFAEWSDINFKGCTVWVLDTTLTNLTIGPLPKSPLYDTLFLVPTFLS